MYKALRTSRDLHTLICAPDQRPLNSPHDCLLFSCATGRVVFVSGCLYTHAQRDYIQMQDHRSTHIYKHIEMYVFRVYTHIYTCSNIPTCVNTQTIQHTCTHANIYANADMQHMQTHASTWIHTHVYKLMQCLPFTHRNTLSVSSPSPTQCWTPVRILQVL